MVNIQKLISFLYPEKIQQNKGIRAILAVDFLLLFFCFITTILFLFAGFLQGALIVGYAFFAALLFLLLPHFTQDLNHLGYYFTFQTLVVCLSLFYFTGGIKSPFQFLIFCISPVSFTFFKKEIALRNSMVTLFCYLSFLVYQISGFPVEQHLSEVQLIVAWVLNFLLGSILFVYTIINFHTGLKSKNTQIKTSNETLKKTNEELERFAYIASHDLKSPLRNILSFITLLDKRYGKDLDENGREFIQIINTNAEQMHHLVEDILEYSKSNVDPKEEEVNLNKVFVQVSDQILNDSNHDDSQIIFPSNLPKIISDFTLLKQVFQNLIENGLKYNDSYKRIVSIQFLEKENEYYFMIKDNGIGMADEYLDQIFEMFKRLHAKNEYHGTGIGLSVCKKFIVKLGGKIWATSKVNEGSIFHISLPKIESFKDEASTQKVKKESFQLN